MKSALAVFVAAMLGFSIPVFADNAYHGTLSSDVKVVSGGGGHGSGVYIGKDLVVTARHVITKHSEDKPKDQLIDQLFVTFDRDGRSAESVGAHPLVVNDADDVAVIKLDHVPDGLPAAKFACRELKIGEQIEVVGSPFDVDFVHTWGKVAGVARRMDDILHAVPVDVNFAPGNSGGPIYDQSGEVIGLADAIVARDTGPGNVFIMTTSPALCDWLPEALGEGEIVPQ
jgi:S1-C subfamily serine protease